MDRSRCQDCGRDLPPNGNCMYCGSLGPSSGVKKRSSFLKSGISAIRNLLFLGIFLFLIFFFVVTKTGRDMATRAIQSIQGMFVEPSEVRKLMMEEVPTLQEWEFEDPGSVTIEEREAGENQYYVTVYYYTGEVNIEAFFTVDLNERRVTPRGYEAERMME